MNKNRLSPEDYQVFLFKSLLLLGIAWVGFGLALAGFFYASIVWVFAIIAGFWMVRRITASKIYLEISREMWLICITFLLVAILFSIFSTPTVFSGRDQGSISEAAIRLAQNHTFEFSTPASTQFFRIYGPGRALNFPGFYYTENGGLTTQFPLTYIVWLALFYAPFGIAGFAVANCLLFFIFFMSFYLLARLFLKTFSAIPVALFMITSFSFMWFSKFTLSENMALPLLWLAILAFMLFLKSPQKLTWLVFLASMLLICFTRIEGFAFLAVSIIIIMLSKDARDYIKNGIGLRFFLPLGIFLLAFFANAFRDMSFYIEIAKAMVPKLTAPQAQILGELESTTLPDFYMTKIFYLYGLLGFFIIGAFGAAVQVWKKDFYKLVPFFIIAPTFIYFLDSHISIDHPWMLRRFVFSLLPVAIFYTGILIGELIENKPKDGRNFVRLKISSGIAVIVILIAANLPAFLKYLTFSENKNLLAETKTFSNQFIPNDLLLIDRKTTGDGWTMLSSPMNFLYGKNAVYFFNTQDLKKLDLTMFNNVYLITPNEQASYYLNSTIGSKLALKNNYNFTFSKLNIEQENNLGTINFPEKKEHSASGKIFKVEK